MNKSTFMKKPFVVWAGALISCALWGSAFPCVKIGYQLFSISSNDTSAQLLFAGMRFFLAGILAIIIGSILYHKPLIPKKSSFPMILELSMLQTVIQYFFFYIGLAHTTGVKASIVEALNVFVAILVAALIYKQETLTIHKIFGCVIGFAGVLVVNLWNCQEAFSFSIFGEGFIFLSTVSYAFSSVYIKRFSQKEEPFILSGYQFLIGGLILIVVGSGMGGYKEINWSNLTLHSFAMLIYLALISAVAYSLWSELLKYNPVSKVAVFGFMNPVFGVILSAILLKQEDTLSITACVISLILVSSGTLLAQKTSGK